VNGRYTDVRERNTNARRRTPSSSREQKEKKTKLIETQKKGRGKGGKWVGTKVRRQWRQQHRTRRQRKHRKGDKKTNGALGAGSMVMKKLLKKQADKQEKTKNYQGQ